MTRATNGSAVATPRRWSQPTMASTSIDQAIVIATETAPATLLKGGKPLAAVKVGGISLLKRTLLVLAKEGVERFAVVVRDLSFREIVVRDPKLAALDVQWVVNDERPTDDGYSVLRAGAYLSGDFILASADRIFEPQIVKQLTAARRGHVTVAVSTDAAAESANSKKSALQFPGHRTFTGLVAGGESLLHTLAVREAQARPMGLGSVLEELAGRSGFAFVDVGTAYWQPVTDKRTRAHADNLLIGSLRKSVDGLVARYVNRVFSLAVTRLLRNTPIRPNHVTAVSLGVSIMAAITAAQATVAHPGWLIVGAALWQLASMLDGVDGELARLKFAGSKMGEWFDTLTDDVGKFLFFIGSGIGAAAVFGSPIWLGLLVFAVTVQMIMSVAIYRKLLQTGSGSHYALAWEDDDKSQQEKPWWSRALDRVEFLGRRDSYVALWLLLSFVGLVQLNIVLTVIITLFVVGNEFLRPRQVREGFVTGSERKPANPQPAH